MTPSSTIRQSFAWWCVSQAVQDAPAFLRAARQIGYQGVELLPHELWNTARDAGLVIASESVGSLTDGLNRRANHPMIEDEVSQKLTLAQQYSILNLIVFSGNRAGLDDESGLEATVEGLRKLAPAAEAAGVNLVIELLNSKVDHPDYQCDHTAWAVSAVEQVASPRVKILYDIYHMQIMEGDLIRTIRAHARHFGHVHTAGNPGRSDPDETQELNYPAILGALKDSGYNGFVGHEFVPKRDPLKALQKAYELCR
ncbi:MAG: TIM barrel protein [Anaerolineaceae bacterium]|nr:TIM barrel protein [Anaerolineaceae bacterium]